MNNIYKIKKTWMTSIVFEFVCVCFPSKMLCEFFLIFHRWLCHWGIGNVSSIIFDWSFKFKKLSRNDKVLSNNIKLLPKIEFHRAKSSYFEYFLHSWPLSMYINITLSHFHNVAHCNNDPKKKCHSIDS